MACTLLKVISKTFLLGGLQSVYETFGKEFRKELSNIDIAAVSRIYSYIKLCYKVLLTHKSNPNERFAIGRN